MVTLRHVPFRQVGSSPIHLRYLEEDPDLRPFLGQRPGDLATLLRRAPLEARRLVAPDALAAALAAAAERHDAPAAARQNCAAIAGGAQLVVAGQQPGLLAGPLYTVHKAATAVRLAQELNAQAGGPRAVPLFWNHTDDHDLDEANRTFLVNSNQDVQRFRLELPRSGGALRDLPIGRAIERLLPALADLLPGTEFRDWAFGLFQPRHPDETLGDQLTRVLYALFGDDGLVVLEPRDLPPAAFDVLPRWWDQAEAIQRTIRTSAEMLLELGLDTALDPAATLMFQQVGGRRTPLADGDELPRATTLSPGALLRPLWQDACLPTIGFVVGPGELAYLAVAGPLYRQLGVPQPVLVPRASMTLVEPSLAKLLRRFDWDLPDLASGAEALAATLAAADSDPAAGTLLALATDVAERLAVLGRGLGPDQKDLAGPLERTRAKIVDDLEKLAARAQNARANTQGTGLRQIRRLCSNLRPRDRMQERVLPPLPFLVNHGRELGQHVLAAASPFATSHGVVEL
jgi:uncharacterized protein YllA (UPF0747 family)